MAALRSSSASAIRMDRLLLFCLRASGTGPAQSADRLAARRRHRLRGLRDLRRCAANSETPSSPTAAETMARSSARETGGQTAKSLALLPSRLPFRPR
jgi:hypothetical protein